jgi:hypothetical protein
MGESKFSGMGINIKLFLQLEGFNCENFKNIRIKIR